MDWYLKCLKQFANFSGRARRKEYWMFVLFNLIFYIVLVFLDVGLKKLVQVSWGRSMDWLCSFLVLLSQCVVYTTLGKVDGIFSGLLSPLWGLYYC